MKDLGDEKISNTRFRNKLHDKYNECAIMTMN